MLKETDFLAICARAVFLVLSVALCLASFVPLTWLPRLLYSEHIDHFAAFYIESLAMAIARFRTKIRNMIGDVIIFSSILEIIRMIAHPRGVYIFGDWMADLGGILAALVPIATIDFRRSYERRDSSADV